MQMSVHHDLTVFPGLTSRQQNAIKFVEPNASVEARKINAVDLGILELRTAIQNMHLQLNGIQSKIDELNFPYSKRHFSSDYPFGYRSTKKASSAVRQKRKPLALSYLGYRRQLEDLMTKRLESLQVLQSTLVRVEAAAGDVEVCWFQSSLHIHP
jgi:charged multivesicular body protein 7